MSRQTTKILDIQVDIVNKKTAIQQFDELIQENSHSLVCTPNTEIIIAAQKDPEFKKILNETSKLNLPDSVGILWAAWFNLLIFPKSFLTPIHIFLTWIGSLILLPFYPRFYKKPITERVPGSEFIWQIANLAAAKDYKLFLLGGAPGIANITRNKIEKAVPNIQIVGTHSGGPRESEEIVNCVNKSNADIIIVAFGAPKQEKWLTEYLPQTCCKAGIGLGGTFDFIAGTRKRAPGIFRKLGLEWLYRLAQEPQRFKRQLSIPVLMHKVLLEKIKVNSK